MASKRATAAAAEPAAATTADPDPSRVITLERGKWYVAAVDTGMAPVSLALDTIEAGLQGKGFGTIRFYRDAAELPKETPPEVRNAKDATVWVSGQFMPPGDAKTMDFVAPPGLLAVAELATEPPKPAPIEKRASVEEGVSTATIVVATATLVIVGGGAIWHAWWLTKKRKNGGKRRRRR